MLGRTEPRLWTPPLRELTPDTSYGYDVIRFADEVLYRPLDPWQAWLAIHAGELLPDGRPRFRRLLVLVARQNGKTELLVVLTLFWLFVDQVGMVLGTSTKLDYAAESWRKACRLARRTASLRAEISHRGATRRANGEQELWRANGDEVDLDEGSRYKISASNEEGGRSHDGQGSVSVVDPATDKVVTTWPIPGGGSPDMGGVSADGSRLWLSGRYDNMVYVFDTATGALIKKIPTVAEPHGLAVWPQPGRYSLGHTGNMR